MNSETTNDLDVKERYFRRLCGLVGIGGPGHRSFLFAKSLFNKEFYWSVPNDDNRAEDGRDLRPRFCGLPYSRAVEKALDGPCSMFEMMIALAERIEDMLATQDGPNNTKDWFWMMVKNLGLREFRDQDHPDRQEADDIHNQMIIDRFLKREYSPNGQGSLFPQKFPRVDVRKVEIWYQVNAYLNENYVP